MSNPEIVLVALRFHDESSTDQRDSDVAYIHEKMDELISETSALACYRVLTDEDRIPINPDTLPCSQ